MNEFTLIVPYYRNVEMLRRQIAEWVKYPENIFIALVDDGSPEPAEDVLAEFQYPNDNLNLYRIETDIPWNRGGARNLGTQQAKTDWIVHVDIDHILPGAQAAALLQFNPRPKHWYRFNRFRVGAADETRMKDEIPRAQAYGKIHPHVDSYLCQRTLYWAAGGYNENFSGCLGGGNDFLHHMTQLSEPGLLDVSLEVYTRDIVKDASDFALSREKSEYTRRRKEMRAAGTLKGADHVRFKWHQVL